MSFFVTLYADSVVSSITAPVEMDVVVFATFHVPRSSLYMLK